VPKKLKNITGAWRRQVKLVKFRADLNKKYLISDSCNKPKKM
jgi:hypothetical protein